MRRFFLLLVGLLFSSISVAFSFSSEPTLSAAKLKIEQQNILKKLGKRPSLFDPWRSESVRSVVLERVKLSPDKKRLELYCNVGLAQIAIRQELLGQWADAVRETLGAGYQNCDVRFFAYKIPAERFIPNAFRPKEGRDPKRASTPIHIRPLTRRADRSGYSLGLGGRHIALWGGHGKYYQEEEDSAWLWQRAPLFTTIEDLNTQEFASRYLAPMLERAGAVVVMARERDPQPAEIILDNDDPTQEGREIDTVGKWEKTNFGFAVSDTLDHQNPFRQGTVSKADISAQFKPHLTYRIALDRPGNYGVYVSWKALPTNLTNARYTVFHAGGQAEFEVNQRIGGSTWVWLGRFDLDSASKIVLSAPEKATTGTLTADAVKIGGGLGNIRRGGTTSGVARYAEAARYWMQYSGVPDSIYAQETLSLENEEGKQLDYIDNFKGNGDWCNYIRYQKNIPLDAAIGLHTDAGICDSIIGTLSIHYTNRTKAQYRNGKSKLAARDLADLVQTQIVSDLRTRHEPHWTRRAIYDKSYAEISRPDIPATLIEMFSHQNAADMALAMDPTFRFDMARAIYKGLLRFLADRYGRRYVVQPLPPSSLYTEWADGDSVRIGWSPTVDPLETTAVPNRYRVYRRIGSDGAFDEGFETRTARVELPIPRDGRVYSFRITAINEGGESFPSEIVSVGLSPTEQGRALVVNGFTRLSPPGLRRDNKSGKLLGFDLESDPGVPYRNDLSIVGPQVDFDPFSPFEENDRPGWGGSSETWYPHGAGGNSFDYPAVHGEALLAAGYSFTSCSRKAFARRQIRPSDYRLVDLILGAQRSYPKRYRIFDKLLYNKLQQIAKDSIPLLISGSYLGCDPGVSAEMRKGLGYGLAETISNPIPRRADRYFTPTFDRLQPTEKGHSIASEDWPTSGVRNGKTILLGFPVEYLEKNALQSLFQHIITTP